MKIGVIGTINKDSIRFAEAPVKHGWGGVLYNLVPFDSLLSENDEVTPVCNIGADCHDDIMKILKGLPRIETRYLKKVTEKNNNCHLTYTDMDNKFEILEGGVPPLKFIDIEPLLNSDIVLLNFISGRDVYLRSMQKFRKLFTGKIYIDIHSLTLGKLPSGRRYLRIPKNWLGFIELADYIQMNRRELDLLSNNRNSGQTGIDLGLRNLRRQLNKSRINFHNKVFIVTDSSNGCHLLYLKKQQHVTFHIRPLKAVMSGNSTGCGDCYSAGFIHGLISGYSLEKCAEAGNRSAVERIQDKSGYFKILS